MKNKKIHYASIILIVITIFFVTISRINIFPKLGLEMGDFNQHFAEMRIHNDTDTFPALGALFQLNTGLFARINPQVPGGFFYLHYLICYKLGLQDFNTARIFNLISMLIPAFIFLFWIFRRFGITIFAILSTLVLMNAYYTYTNIVFYNPNLTLTFSFLLIPIFGEYVVQKKAFIPAMMMFPILALMGQAHFAVYYGIVPTLIIYLLIRFNKTKKYFLAHLLGVFLAFVTYIPYLAYEIRNNFENFNKAISFAQNAEGLYKIPFPQVHSLFMFPTNEFSVLYTGNNFEKLIGFYLNDNPYMIIAFPVLILSMLIIFSTTIFTIHGFFKKKEWKSYDFNKIEKKDEQKIILKELIFLFLLYFPVTILVTIVAKGVPGQFRYHYGVFALSFIPITYALFYMIKSNKQKMILSLLIFYMINTFVMYGGITTYYKKYQEPSSINDNIDTVQAIASDANGEEFKIMPEPSSFTERGIAYNKMGSWNENTNSTNIIYYIQSTKSATNIDNSKLIIKNNIYVVNKKTNK